jgi:hypothetical protein
MMKNPAAIFCLLGALALTACGGGSGSGSSGGVEEGAGATLSQSQPAAAPNALAVVVDRGPSVFLLTGRKVVNMLYASVTFCTPGSTTACETIDHIAVDTGSVGLRVLASALSGKASMKTLGEPVSGSPLRECVQFADGHTWGSVVTADVKIAGHTLASLPVNLVGDPAAGATPPSCISGPALGSVAAFGANGVLGVGSFLHDCGPDCASQAIAGMYYVCPSAGTGALCRPTAVALDQQVRNPVAALGNDNNGVTIQLPPVPQAGSASVSGTVYFGVGTQANNTVADARLFKLDRFGTLLTSYGGITQRAIVDSGSNGYFFTSESLTTCARNSSFYCPTVAGVATSAPQMASIMGHNGVSQTVGFTVDNIDQVFTGQAALPGVAAPSSGLVGGAASLFDWGLPFFFGRTVHVLFEGKTLDGTTGPAVGF